MTIAYLTDVEGRWDKLESFVARTPELSLDEGALRLADGVTFVFGGDAIDRGPHGRRIVRLLLDARRRYGERVVLLAGNRDINKLRLWRELQGAPPESTPDAVRAGPRGALLRWVFAHTMGAQEAFEHRAAELAAAGRRAEDDEVVSSFLEDLAPGGELARYLAECRLAARIGETLFVHGAVTRESLGAVPSRRRPRLGVDAWIDALDDLYASEIDAFVRGREPATLIAYQAPRPGTRWNQASVVYGRLTDEHANPHLPHDEVIAQLREAGVHRLVVGHAPSGDCPAILREADFELVLADNSYSRNESGSSVVLEGERARISGVTELDDGRRLAVRLASSRTEPPSPLGQRDRASGQLVKARVETGEYLLFRGRAGYRVEQALATEDELALRPLGPPR